MTLKPGGAPNKTAVRTKTLSRRFSILPNIEAKVIPHEDHRYETAGDYWNETETCQIAGKIGPQKVRSRHYRISSMKNADYEFLVLVHELIEHHLCESRGIKEKDITAFDEAFEKKRKPGNTDEPGFDLMAPYRDEHKFSTFIEMKLANELGVDWKKYCKALENL